VGNFPLGHRFPKNFYRTHTFRTNLEKGENGTEALNNMVKYIGARFAEQGYSLH